MDIRLNKRTIIIGDLHIKNIPSVPGYISAQVNTIREIIEREAVTPRCNNHIDNIIFLGDVFHNRKPTPTELLNFKQLLETVNHYAKNVFVVRGNHESETKSDDGITALSLFAGPNTHIFEHVGNHENYTFIPHYEDESRIVDALSKVPGENFVFGHWGYIGSLNSVGNADFSINRDRISNQTFLGHIHHYKEEAKVTVVGTPYTTSFQEAGKKNYYGVLEETDKGWSFQKVEINHGIRHMVVDYHDLSKGLISFQDMTDL